MYFILKFFSVVLKGGKTTRREDNILTLTRCVFDKEIGHRDLPLCASDLFTVSFLLRVYILPVLYLEKGTFGDLKVNKQELLTLVENCFD